jgi:hypothetical protein
MSRDYSRTSVSGALICREKSLPRNLIIQAKGRARLQNLLQQRKFWEEF